MDSTQSDDSRFLRKAAWDKRFLMCGFLALAGCMDSATTGDFHTRTGVKVFPVNAAVFEVAARPGSVMIHDFWCGAGEYARRVLGASNNDRVYVVSEAGPGVASPSNSTVQFSMSPPGQTQGALGNKSHWGPNIGTSSSVVQARSRCRDNLNFDD